MSRRGIIAIVGIVVFSFLVVIILYGLSDRPIIYSQNFTRVFRQDVIQKRNIMDMKGDSYYIAGATASRIFFGNEKDSLDLLVTNTLLSSPQHVQVSIANEEILKLEDSRIEIDSPFFYIKAGGLPGIFRGTIDHWRATRILDGITLFDHAVALTKNSFAFQATGAAEGSTTSQNILCKMSEDVEEFKLNPDILEGQVDDYFSTLGVLRYSKKLNYLVYTYLFRNQYLVIDTNLNLRYKASTIDPVSQARIKPIEVSKGRYTLASTSAIVNRSSQIYENLLFVNSNLMGTNETKESFDNVSVIDVYDIQKNMYQFSFYLPDHNATRMSSFKVMDDRILALHGHYAVTYFFSGQHLAKHEL